MTLWMSHHHSIERALQSAQPLQNSCPQAPTPARSLICGERRLLHGTQDVLHRPTAPPRPPPPPPPLDGRPAGIGDEADWMFLPQPTGTSETERDNCTTPAAAAAVVAVAAMVVVAAVAAVVLVGIGRGWVTVLSTRRYSLYEAYTA